MSDLITIFATSQSDVIQRVPVSFKENDDEWYLTDKIVLPDLWNKLQNQTLCLNCWACSANHNFFKQW